MSVKFMTAHLRERKSRAPVIFAEALMKKGISVMDEEELERNFFLKHKEEL